MEVPEQARGHDAAAGGGCPDRIGRRVEREALEGEGNTEVIFRFPDELQCVAQPPISDPLRSPPRRLSMSEERSGSKAVHRPSNRGDFNNDDSAGHPVL